MTSGRVKNYNEFSRKNIQDFCNLGFTPTSSDLLKSFNIDLSLQVQYEDPRACTDFYWKKLGLDKIFGQWPLINKNDDDPDYWKDIILGNYEDSFKHPYLVLTMITGEILSKRNCIIRGNEHYHEKGLIHFLGQAFAIKYYGLTGPDALHNFVPTQFFIPKLCRSGTRLPEDQQKPSGIVLSSSLETTKGFFVKDIIKAGIEPYVLRSKLEEILLGNRAGELDGIVLEKIHIEDPSDAQMIQAGVRKLFNILPREIIIDDDDWFYFLKTGGKNG